jgi:hypothetical protein
VLDHLAKAHHLLVAFTHVHICLSEEFSNLGLYFYHFILEERFQLSRCSINITDTFVVPLLDSQ